MRSLIELFLSCFVQIYSELFLIDLPCLTVDLLEQKVDVKSFSERNSKAVC